MKYIYIWRRVPSVSTLMVWFWSRKSLREPCFKKGQPFHFFSQTDSILNIVVVHNGALRFFVIFGSLKRSASRCIHILDT